jgi:hypothetical protein
MIYVTSIMSCLIFPLASKAFALDEPADALKKTGFIFNFLKYIEFRDDPKDMDICIIGSKPIFELVDKFSAASTTKNLEVKFFTEADMEIRECDVVFLSFQADDQARKVMSITAGAEKFILTISDIPNFIGEMEGLIQIYKKRDTQKYGLNLKKFASENVEVSSKLLESADSLY